MKKTVISIVIIALVGFGIYKKVYIPKHTFETTQVKKGDMSVRVNGIGNVGAKDIYKIGSVYSGKVLNSTAHEGDFIKRGDTIAIVDSIDLKYKIQEQEALLKKLNSDIKSLEIEEQSAKISYEYQNSIFVKNQELYDRHSISQTDYAKYKTNRDTSRLSISMVQTKRDSLYNQAQQLEANIKGLREKLSRYTILSPVDGYIIQKPISNYQIVSPNQTIVEIVNPADVWVKTYIDTRMSGDVKIGDRATILLRSSHKKVWGKIVHIKPINNSVTNEREVDVAFDKLAIPFYLEEQASVSIYTRELKDIVKIPTKLITIYKEQSGVWIVDSSHKIHFKSLDILAYQEKAAAVGEFDIKQMIVIPNPKSISLKDGMKIFND